MIVILIKTLIRGKENKTCTNSTLNEREVDQSVRRGCKSDQKKF